MNEKEVEKLKSEEFKENKMVAQTQYQLIFRQFIKHKLALIGILVLVLFYTVGVFLPEFFAPYGKFTEFEDTYLPPQSVYFIDANGNFHIRPFTYEWEKKMDPDTYVRTKKILEMTYNERLVKIHEKYDFDTSKI